MSNVSAGSYSDSRKRDSAQVRMQCGQVYFAISFASKDRSVVCLIADIVKFRRVPGSLCVCEGLSK